MWHPAPGCPSEAVVRHWLSSELDGAAGTVLAPVVATAFFDGDGEWMAVLHRSGGRRSDADVLRARDCTLLAHLVVEEIVFDVGTEPPPIVPVPVATLVSDQPMQPVPTLTTTLVLIPGLQAETSPVEAGTPSLPGPFRFAVDVGIGLGFASASGTPTLVNQPPVPSNLVLDCGSSTCSGSVSSALGQSTFVSLATRFNVTNRVGLSLGVRFATDSAGWTATRGSSGYPVSVPNQLANLLFNARVYYAFGPRGFVPDGLVTSAFWGVGYGQIEPNVTATSIVGVTYSTHVVTGLVNAHTGFRFEYGFAGHLAVAAEVTLQVMASAVLVDVDASVHVGFHL